MVCVCTHFRTFANSHLFCLSQEDVAMAKHGKDKENKMDVYQQEALARKNWAKCHRQEDTQTTEDMI